MTKKYPSGLQDFREIRQHGYVYVDKTQWLHRMVMMGKYHFLSRPRRFGKSLTCSTLKYLFQGERSLFEGLWIADQYDFSQVHPVIHLELSGIAYAGKGLAQAITDRLRQVATSYGVSLQSTAPDACLRELILQISKRNQVVLLIDEYDKPILDYLEDSENSTAVRDELKAFYAPLKSLDQHLRFVFLTGVSKFSRMSIFSELNNLEDLTLHPDCSMMTGYTEQEMQQYFGEDVAALSGKLKMSEAECWAKLRQWYIGYSWDGENFVYNPVSVLNLLKQGRFYNFWFATGTPTFLVKMLNRQLPQRYEGIQTSFAGIESFELDRLAPIPLLFQTGYLTIKAMEGQAITLDYPNQEVRQSLSEYLLSDLSEYADGEVFPLILGMVNGLRQGDLEQFVGQMDALFARIPYQIFQRNREGCYQTVVYLAFVLMKTHVDCEPSQRHDRPDLVVQLPDRVYVMELKLGATPSEAIGQIRAKGYAQPYLHQGKEVLLVGISFSAEQKGVADWSVEREV